MLPSWWVTTQRFASSTLNTMAAMMVRFRGDMSWLRYWAPASPHTNCRIAAAAPRFRLVFEITPVICAGTLLSMAALRHRGCRIFVAGRAADASKGGDGATDGSPPEFLTLRDMHLSEALASLVRRFC